MKSASLAGRKVESLRMLFAIGCVQVLAMKILRFTLSRPVVAIAN